MAHRSAFSSDVRFLFGRYELQSLALMNSVMAAMARVSSSISASMYFYKIIGLKLNLIKLLPHFLVL